MNFQDAENMAEAEAEADEERRDAAILAKTDKDAVKRLKRRLRRNWQKGNFDKCVEAIEEIEPSTVHYFRNQLADILNLNPDFFTFATEGEEEILSVRRKVLDLFERTPDDVALPILVSALFIENEELLERVIRHLRSKGKKTLSPLIQRLRASYYTEDPVKKAGVKRVIQQLGELRDKRASAALFDVVKGELLGMPPNDASSCSIFVFAGVVVYLIGNALPYDFTWEWFAGMWAMLFAPAFLFNRFVGAWFRRRKERKNNAEMVREALIALTHIPIKRNIPAILSLRILPAMERMPEYHALLAAHFALLAPEDSELFQLSDRLWLVRGLERYSESCTLTLLKGLEFCGREEAQERVQELAAPHVARAVQAEAKRIYPLIEARTEARRARMELLRAANAPEDTQSLLRPVYGERNAEEEQELLRPVE